MDNARHIGSSDAVELDTSRLRLRPFVAGDFDDVHAYAGDPKVVRYMDWGPNTRAQTQAFLREAIAAYAERPWRNLSLALEYKTEGCVIGSCALNRMNALIGEAALGYCLHRAYWGQGYATEGAAALLRYGLEHLGCRRIIALCRPENTASQRVLEKLGMHREGYLRAHVWVRGQWQDSLLYAIVAA